MFLGRSCICSENASLVRKDFKCLRVAGQFIRKALKGNESTDFGLFGLVNDTHPTSTTFFLDAEVGDGLANHG